MKEPLKLQYIVNPNNFMDAGIVSQKVKSKLNELKIDSEIVRKAAIAIYEGELNMILHANGGIIHVEITEDVLTVIFEDNGPGIEDIEKVLQPGFSSVSDDSELRSKGYGAGQGFSKIRKSVDSFDIQSEVGKGTTVTISVNLK